MDPAENYQLQAHRPDVRAETQAPKAKSIFQFATSKPQREPEHKSKLAFGLFTMTRDKSRQFKKQDNEAYEDQEDEMGANTM